METIGRVCVHAKPTKNHRTYREWETANIVVLVKANQRDLAIARAVEFIKSKNWDLLSIELCDRIIEEHASEQGGEFWEVYQQAKAHGAAMRVFPKLFAPGSDGIPPMFPPRVTEAFIDSVVLDVGGQRLETDEKNKIADYLIGEWIFELKDLQQEGLLHTERQKKLALLFEPYSGGNNTFHIDPRVLNENEAQRYYDIMSSPIQSQVKSASKQIRSTKQVLGKDSLRGGLIYLNTGYGSIPPDMFGPLVDRYVKKNTTQIEAVCCASTWSMTNGYDTEAWCKLYPRLPEIPVVVELQYAFRKRFENAILQLIRGNLPEHSELSKPLTPVAFTRDGLQFSWQPPTLPNI